MRILQSLGLSAAVLIVGLAPGLTNAQTDQRIGPVECHGSCGGQTVPHEDGPDRICQTPEEALVASLVALQRGDWGRAFQVWIDYERSRCQRGQAALSAVKKLENDPGVLEELVGPFLPGDKSLPFRITYDARWRPRPQWLRDFLGDNRFVSVQKITSYRQETNNETLAHIGALTSLRELDLSNGSFTDEGFAHLADLPRLRKLYIGNHSITDQGIAQVAGLPRLRSLNLLGAKVTGSGLAGFSGLEELGIGYGPLTDEGLATISRIEGLNSLDISNTQITDAGLKELTPLKRLKQLKIAAFGGDIDGNITDAGIAHLADMTQLEMVSLHSPSITDASLAHLEALKKLKFLSVLSDQISDAGLANLRQFEHLETLMLTSPNISDAGLEHLAGLRKLRSLHLLHSGVSAAGAAKLKKSLPELKIWRF